MHRPVSLDPLVGRDDPASRDIGRLLYRRLIRLDGSGVAKSDLAVTWGVSGDGMVYRFTLDRNARWSDGSPLRVDDVAATVAAVQTPGFPDVQLSAEWRGVSVGGGSGPTVTLTIPGPRASFAATVADLPILPVKALRGHTPVALIDTAARPLPTSGPFRAVSADATLVRLEPNPWARPSPQLHTVELRLEPNDDAALHAFAAGQVDAVLAAGPAERAAAVRVAGTRLYDMLTFRFVDLLLNSRRPGLDDPAVRHAIGGAIDRRALVGRALGGAARVQVDAIPAGVLWITDRPAEQPSPQLSARALDAAGWHPGGDGVRVRDGVPLSFTLSVPDAAPLPAVARELRRQLGLVGIDVKLRPVAAGRFAPDVLMTEAFDMALADWDNGPDPDVSTYWRSNATPPQGANVTGLSADPFLDQALDSLATETDVALRQQAAQRVDQRLADDAPAVFLYAPKVTMVVSDGLDGIRLPAAGAPADRYTTVATWYRKGG